MLPQIGMMLWKWWKWIHFQLQIAMEWSTKVDVLSWKSPIYWLAFGLRPMGKINQCIQFDKFNQIKASPCWWTCLRFPKWTMRLYSNDHHWHFGFGRIAWCRRRIHFLPNSVSSQIWIPSQIPFSENRALSRTSWRIFRDDMRIVSVEEMKSMVFAKCQIYSSFTLQNSCQLVHPKLNCRIWHGSQSIMQWLAPIPMPHSTFTHNGVQFHFPESIFNCCRQWSKWSTTIWIHLWELLSMKVRNERGELILTYLLKRTNC